jgi:hypothetical protein
VLLQTISVVPLCRIESGSRNDLCDHLDRPLVRAIYLGLHALRHSALFVAVIEDHRAVLRASVVAGSKPLPAPQETPIHNPLASHRSQSWRRTPPPCRPV